MVASLPPKRSLLQEPLEGFEKIATHDGAFGGDVRGAVVMRSGGLVVKWWCILMGDGWR